MRPAGIYKSHDIMTSFHGLLTSEFSKIIKSKFFVQVESEVLLMVGCIFMRPADIYKSHDIMFPIYHGLLTLDLG